MARLVDVWCDGAHVSDSFNNVPSAGFAFSADHGCTFGYATEGFAQVAAAADKWDAEGVFFDVMGAIGGGEDFWFVNVIYSEGFEDLGVVDLVSVLLSGIGAEAAYLTLDKMAYSCFRHDGNRDGVHYLLDHLGIWHACYTALGSDICWDSLESHYCTCACFLRYSCLFAVVSLFE